MKYIKTYENREYKAIQFQDENLIVHKITEGANKGLIKFKFFNEIDKKYSDVCSITYGTAKILDTEYEKNSIIRNVTILDKYKKIQSTTIKITLLLFFKQLGYTDDDYIRKITYEDRYVKNTKIIMENNFHDAIKRVHNLGELFDEVRKIRDYFFYLEEDNFKKWQLEQDVDKYNL